MIDLLPLGVDPVGAAALVAFSTLTSALTAAVGIGGGVLLLAAMTFVVPVEAIIPVHAVAQLGSNAGRGAVLAKLAEWRLIAPFALAAIGGAAAGALLVTQVPDAILFGAIGAFVLVTAWVKPPPLGRGETAVLAAGGFAATLLTMFVGATGPFVIALYRQACASHRTLVATNAVAMTIQHGLKVGAFVAVGFAFAAWAPLLAAIIASGFVGTLVGAQLLSSLPEKPLAIALKWTLTAIGAQLLVRAALTL